MVSPGESRAYQCSRAKGYSESVSGLCRSVTQSSSVCYLRKQGEMRSLLMSDLTFEIYQFVDQESLVVRNIHSRRNVLADSAFNTTVTHVGAAVSLSTNPDYLCKIYLFIKMDIIL